MFLWYAANIMSKKIDNVSEWNDICICGPTVVSKSCTTEIIRELVAGSHQNMNWKYNNCSLYEVWITLWTVIQYGLPVKNNFLHLSESFERAGLTPSMWEFNLICKVFILCKACSFLRVSFSISTDILSFSTLSFKLLCLVDLT